MLSVPPPSSATSVLSAAPFLSSLIVRSPRYVCVMSTATVRPLAPVTPVTGTSIVTPAGLLSGIALAGDAEKSCVAGLPPPPPPPAGATGALMSALPFVGSTLGFGGDIVRVGDHRKSRCVFVVSEQ